MTSKSSSTTSGSNGSSNVKMSPAEIQEFQEAFHFFDTDKDGYVATSDVGRLMRCVGLFPSEAELQQMCKSSRTKVDFNEFLQLACSNLVDTRINEQQMREAFRMFDSYGNGLVNLMQMRNALQNLGEKLRDDEIDELIREADIDAEGNVNYDELVKILCRN
jgi:Ca2+-binding EF-hand superfamily protein